ncbi:hypothetical protein FHT12_000896 [Xanthomonas campestris]|nr:hypothetical protein [Xanthomonas euroxanthea]
MSARRSDWQSWMPNCCATAADRNQALQPASRASCVACATHTDHLDGPCIQPDARRSCCYPCAPTLSTGPCPPPSRDPERHGCRAGAYMDVLAACPAMVGGQGPRSKLAAPKARRPRRTRQCADCLLEALHIAPLDGSLSAHRRGTLSGMDAAPEPTWTYLRRVLRRWAGKGPAANSPHRGRGALTACGTRREPIPGDRVAASMPLHGPATGEDTALDRLLVAARRALRTNQRDWSLPAHRRGTLSGMDAAPEPTRTYLRRVLRRWAGKGLAAEPQTICSASFRRCASGPWALRVDVLMGSAKQPPPAKQ